MKFVIQRVQNASVTVDNEVIGSINKGLLILIGVSNSDTEETADKMLKKACNLRIFSDENDKINLSLKDVNGELLLVSQFTLYANCKKGIRPSFFDAGSPDHAEKIYNYIIEQAVSYSDTVRHGEFGADMKVSLLNDGPFTIILDSDEL